MWAVSIFASQASAQGRGTEYLSQVYARYFARWPVRLNLDVAWAVAKQKEVSLPLSNTLHVCLIMVQRIRIELHAAHLKTHLMTPPMRWDHLFALAPEKFASIEGKLLQKISRKDNTAHVDVNLSSQELDPGPCEHEQVGSVEDEFATGLPSGSSTPSDRG